MAFPKATGRTTMSVLELCGGAGLRNSAAALLWAGDTCRGRAGMSAGCQTTSCGCCGLPGVSIGLLTPCTLVMLVPLGNFCGVTLMGPGRGENQPQHVLFFSFLSITSSQPWLDGLELEGCVRVSHTSKRKTCLWRLEKVGSREYVSVINLFSHWVPMLAHIW